MAPICQISYASKFLLNTVILPAGLQFLVFVTWAFNSKAARKAQREQQPDAEKQEDSESAEELELELKASKRGDHYFAFFLTCAWQIDLRSQLSFSL